jgi:4-carboxymuconolactone decarboxylase
MDLPPDVFPQSGNRLPVPRREDLDEANREIFDNALKRTITGLRGPTGIQLHSKVAPHLFGLNQYLRFGSKLTGRMREVAILTVAREMDSQFEWAAHEAVALREGVPAELVEAIRARRPVDGFDPGDALIIAFGRQMAGERKVDAALYARARDHFGQPLLVDLVFLMADYAATALVLAAFDMQLPPGQDPRL